MSAHNIFAIAAVLAALGLSLRSLDRVHRLRLELYALELKLARARDDLCAIKSRLDRLDSRFDALLGVLSEHSAANARTLQLWADQCPSAPAPSLKD